MNKAQSLTIKEDVIVHLVGSSRFRPASKHGLPFVAFTRSESFGITAFKNLLPWGDFLKGNDWNMLRIRLDFTHPCNSRQHHHHPADCHVSSRRTTFRYEASAAMPPNTSSEEEIRQCTDRCRR